MVIRNGVQPSHIFFAGDIFLFCNGERMNVSKLLGTLADYQTSSGQMVSLSKSKCFVGGTSNARKQQIAGECNMCLANFPDKYLGVILTTGSMSACMGMCGNVIRQLSWLEGEVIVVPEKESEKIIRNFFWSGDPSVRKPITLKWEKACPPLDEGGLGIRQLEDINKSMLMKLCWKMQNGNDKWSRFFQPKFQDKTGNWIEYYKKSSIWPGIKWVAPEVFEHFRWLVGDGKNISVWSDIWIKDTPLKILHPENTTMQQNPDMKWLLLMNALEKKFQKLQWTKFVWHKPIHPNIASNVWKLVRGIVPADDKMKKRKFQLASRCPFCKNSEENLEHILWFCDFSEIIWSWLGGISSFTNPKSFEDILTFANHKSPSAKEIWKVAALVTLKEIWFMGNKMVYEEEPYNCDALKKRIISFTKDSDVRMSGVMWNSAYDLQILNFLELECRRVKTVKVTEIFFYLPDPSYFLICCDGASRGNPGAAGYGFICRK
ncbi:uncharacterized protein LOC113360302 [Papaver somniferum]|uniref:uncharacterized protein LOC113360302 n=1 Tax=Papaver somniferum TaxID=3469 RepID=UPI000E6FE38A|nr:uncharacterized protein LOC113360302 [Papaver somniferum]